MFSHCGKRNSRKTKFSGLFLNVLLSHFGVEKGTECLKKKLALKHYGPIKPYQIKYSYLFYNYFSFKHSVIFPSSILKWPTNGRRKTSQHDFCVRQDSADIEFFVYVKLLLQQKFLL